MPIINKSMNNNRQYIELTSSHRNRTRYPNPAQFEVRLAESNMKNNVYTAQDPVYNSGVKYPVSPSNTYSTFGYMYGTSDTSYVDLLPMTVNAAGEISTLALPSSGFIGETIELVSNVVGSVVTTSHEYRTIVDYEKVPLSTTSIATTIDAVQPIYTTSVPLSSSLALTLDSSLIGWTIEFTVATDPTLVGVKRTITDYRGYDQRVYFDQPILQTITAADKVVLQIPTYRVRLNTPFSVTLPLALANLSLADHTTFRIRTSAPMREGTFVSGTTNTFVLPASVGSLNYTGYMLWITTDPLVFSGALTSATFIASGGAQVQGTFVLPAGASVFPDQALKNMTITLTSGPFAGHSYLITNWDNATLTGTVTPGWTSLVAGTTNPAVGNTFTITQPTPDQYRFISIYDPATRAGTVSLPFSYTNELNTKTTYAITSSDTFDLLQFKTDNYYSLDYPDSVVNQQQASCYEIELISLSLPNTVLKTSLGSQIAFYPYVYVEFKSVTQGTSAFDFNSNNPAVSKYTMFRAPLIYNQAPYLLKFINVDGHGMVQTLKFKPNDAFSFSVYLPNGELFTTEPDTMSPLEPNPWLQISVCFGIRRQKIEFVDNYSTY